MSLTEKMTELYYIKELTEGTFPLYLKLTDQYHGEEPILTEKITCAEYKKGYFRGKRNTIKLVTFKDTIVIPQLL